MHAKENCEYSQKYFAIFAKKFFSININMKKFQLTGQFHNKESNKLKYDKCDEIWNNETMVELYIMKVHDKENSKYEHAV